MNVLFYYKIILKVYLFNYSNAPELGFVILMKGKMRLRSIFSMFLFFLFVFWIDIVTMSSFWKMSYVYRENLGEKPISRLYRNVKEPGFKTIMEILIVKKALKN